MLTQLLSLFTIYRYERGLSDIISIIIFSFAIFMVYTLLDVESEYIRYIATVIWLAWLTIYTYLTSFKGYFQDEKCYYKRLIPISINATYMWEYLRTMVVYGGITLSMIFAIDLLVEVFLSGKNLQSVPSLCEVLMKSYEPLNYLPSLAYMAIIFHAVAFLSSTNLKWMMSAIVPLCLIIPTGDYQEYIYPFLSQKAEWDFIEIQLAWLPRIVEYFFSYLWFALLPLSLYTLSYFRIKQ